MLKPCAKVEENKSRLVMPSPECGTGDNVSISRWYDVQGSLLSHLHSLAEWSLYGSSALAGGILLLVLSSCKTSLQGGPCCALPFCPLHT